MTSAQSSLPPEIDLNKPSIARVYDYLLGGKDNFEVDRVLGDQLVETSPDTALLARDNRRWVQRAVRWLARDAGVDQFIDLGSGLPTAENTHQVAQRFNPDAVVVYVDNDPTVIAHGHALLEDNDNTHFIGADLTDPGQVYANPAVTEHLELDRPLAVLHCLTLHHVPGQDNVARMITGYVGPLAGGSYLCLTHIRQPEPDDERAVRAAAFTDQYRKASPGYTPRLFGEIQALLTGLTVVDPGLVPINDWWPEGPPAPQRDMAEFVVGAVAKKP